MFDVKICDLEWCIGISIAPLNDKFISDAEVEESFFLEMKSISIFNFHVHAVGQYHRE